MRKFNRLYSVFDLPLAVVYLLLYPSNAATTARPVALLPCSSLSSIIHSVYRYSKLALSSLHSQRASHHIRKARHNRRIMDIVLRSTSASDVLQEQ